MVSRTHGRSCGSDTTVPPSSRTLAAASSALSTAKVTSQRAGASGATAATTSAKPSGAPISSMPLVNPGASLSCSSWYPGRRIIHDCSPSASIAQPNTVP